MAKLKSGFLICLVIMSIILAIHLMLGQPLPPLPPQHEEVWFGPEPGLHEVSLPGRIYLISAGEILLVETFSRMYNDLVVTLGQIEYETGGVGDAWAPGEYIEDDFPPGVLFRYDYPLSRELLASWWALFYETDFPFAAVDSIFVPLDQGPVRFINSSAREVWLLQASLTWDVFARAVSEPKDVISYCWVPMESGENYTVASGVFQLEESEVLVVPDWVKEEINNTSLIRSFYLKPSLIKESDGTEIYTDGVQALRLYPSGALEYTVVNSQANPGSPGQGAWVKTAVNFVTAHGGWPENMLPTYLSIIPSEQGRLEFARYGLGFPIIGQAGIAVEMDGAAVCFYSRDMVWIRPESVAGYAEIKPLSTLLSNPSTQAAQFFSAQEAEITDLALAYFWQQERMVPVWRVWVGQQVICVGAVDGRILNVRTRSGGD